MPRAMWTSWRTSSQGPICWLPWPARAAADSSRAACGGRRRSGQERLVERRSTAAERLLQERADQPARAHPGKESDDESARTLLHWRRSGVCRAGQGLAHRPGTRPLRAHAQDRVHEHTHRGETDLRPEPLRARERQPSGPADLPRGGGGGPGLGHVPCRLTEPGSDRLHRRQGPEGRRGLLRRADAGFGVYKTTSGGRVGATRRWSRWCARWRSIRPTPRP